MSRLIIAEKEEAAEAIAAILSGGNQERRRFNGEVTYFVFGGDAVAAARGHLIHSTLSGQRRVQYLADLPLSEVAWRPHKGDLPRLKAIKSLARDSDQVIIATDFDREGEVIGYNIAKALGVDKPDEIVRAYFSALTQRDVEGAFANLGPMDETLLSQGLARNIADLVIGLNLTKALTLLYKREFSRLSQAMSLGRVQSPLLQFLSSSTGIQVNESCGVETMDREWVEHHILVDGHYYETKLEPYETGEDITQVTVDDIDWETSEIPQAEKLFNTNDIMSAIRISPSALMNTLESLYLKGWATYPRTESRYIDPERLESLEKTIRRFQDLPEEFSYTHCPIEDEADKKKQAIVLTERGIEAYHTGLTQGRERFVAGVILNQMVRSFACPLEKETTCLDLKLSNGEMVTLEWSEEIPDLDRLAITRHECVTRPDLEIGKTYPVLRMPKKIEAASSDYPLFYRRITTYTDTELVEWMEQEGIGTEATRATFPDVLRDRHYSTESNLVTVLGEEVAKIIKDIELDVGLTRETEQLIHCVHSLNNLPRFQEAILGKTSLFLSKLTHSPDIDLRCPKSHRAELINTSEGLFLLCQECGPKFYRI